MPDQPWIVQHRAGWCALPPGAEPDHDALNDPTLCGYVVTLRWASKRGKPDCPECLAALLGKGRAVADLREVQRRAWANKLAKGFNVTDVALEFGLTMEELAEAFSAWRKGKSSLGAELADVAIFLAGLAEMTGVDLDAEVRAKLAVNEQRAYERLPNGTPVKAEQAVREQLSEVPRG